MNPLKNLALHFLIGIPFTHPGGPHLCSSSGMWQSSKVPMYVLPFHVTLSMSKPFSVSFQTMPDTFTAVPGSQGPRLSGSVMVAASGWPPEVLPPNPATGEATEAGEADSSLSTLPLEQSPLSCKRNKNLVIEKWLGYFFFWSTHTNRCTCASVIMTTVRHYWLLS